jgi:hypothetical protein
MSSASVSGLKEGQVEQFYRRYPTTLRNCKTIGDVSTIYKVAKYSLKLETKVKEVLMEFMEKGYLTTTDVRPGMVLEWIGEADSAIIPNKSPKENKEKGPENLVHFSAQYFLEEAEMNPYERERADEDEYIADPHIEPKRGIEDIRPTSGFLTLFTNRYELEQFYLDTMNVKKQRAFNSAQVFNSLVKFHRIVKEKEAKLVWGFRPPKASKWVSFSETPSNKDGLETFETKPYNPLDSMESLAMSFIERYGEEIRSSTKKEEVVAIWEKYRPSWMEEEKDKWSVWQNVIMYYDDIELPAEGICLQFLDIWEDDGLLTRVPGKYHDVPPTYIWA